MLIVQVEIKSRPSVPDNVHNWQVFGNDNDLLDFLTCEGRYQDQIIDTNSFIEKQEDKETLFGEEIVQLISNKITKGWWHARGSLIKMKTSKPRNLMLCERKLRK